MSKQLFGLLVVWMLFSYSSLIQAGTESDQAIRILNGHLKQSALVQKSLVKMKAGDFSLNDEEEDALGSLFVSSTLGVAPILDKPDIQIRVNQLGLRIAAVTERPQLNWRFVVINTPEVNAFAAPGGYVLVTTGLYQMLDTEEELMAVLAHETSIKWLEGKTPKKVIVVTNKIVNIVI